ncbi:MAG: DNA polymerase III subunit delta [Bacteroidales bacterium]
MKYEQIIREISNKQFAPVYFLSGEESYFIDSIASLLEQEVLDESEKAFNQTILYGRDISLSQVVSEARRFPMMADHHLVIVREAQEMNNFPPRDKKHESTKGSPEELLYSYLKDPLKSTVLVFLYKNKRIDARTSLGRMFTRHGILFESKKLYDNQVPDWIQKYVQNQACTISDKASLMLTEYLGADLSKVSNELEKLLISLPKGGKIDLKLIEKNIGISKDFNVFELVNALANKDVYKANLIGKYFADNPKQNPLLKTLPALFNFFSKVIMYIELYQLPKNELAAKLGVHPFFLKDYQIASKNYRPLKLHKIIHHLRVYDLKAKGVDNANVDDGELLKELLFKILH